MTGRELRFFTAYFRQELASLVAPFIRQRDACEPKFRVRILRQDGESLTIVAHGGG